MAKQDSLILLQGTHDGITFVKSPTYGDHIRRPRGTIKKATLNNALKAQSKKTIAANGPAKIIKDAIDPFRRRFYDGKLWFRLLAMVQEASADGHPFDFSKLKPFELNATYPLDRLLKLDVNTTINGEKTRLHVDLSYRNHPRFEEKLGLHGYRIGVIAIYPDAAKTSAETGAVYSDIALTEKKPAPLSMQLPVPEMATTFLVCVTIEGYMNGKLDSAFNAKGMKMVAAGLVSREP